MEDRISYFERMLADNPENPTGLLALANEYKKAGREEDEAAVLKRYVEAHERERTLEGNAPLGSPSAPASPGTARGRSSCWAPRPRLPARRAARSPA